MTRRNSRSTTQNPSPKKAIFWTVITIMIVLAYFMLKESPLQEIKIYKTDLSSTIGGLIVMEEDGYINMPEGILKEVKRFGKDKIIYNTILRGIANTLFSNNGIYAYLEVHPRDVIWKEHTGKGEILLWVFLEEGTLPDKEFFEIKQD